MKLSFKNCARCGQEHADLDFKAFSRPVRVGEVVFTHWFTCPVTGDPILYREIEFSFSVNGVDQIGTTGGGIQVL